jgi:hypothetical protein
MAITNIADLIAARESRSFSQQSFLKPQHGAITYDMFREFRPTPGTAALQMDGFVFGRDTWGVGIFGTETSEIGKSYGL